MNKIVDFVVDRPVGYVMEALSAVFELGSEHPRISGSIIVILAIGYILYA